MNDSITVPAVAECGSPGDLRRWFPAPREKQPCFVCGEWQAIAHWHHAPSIQSVVRADVLAWQLAGFKWPLFSLCPNHHAAVHVLAGRRAGREEVLLSLAAEEAAQIDRIIEAERAAWTEILEAANA